MKEFLLVRHGAYDDGQEKLNDRGLEQTEKVIEYLSNNFHNQKATVLSSQGPRAKQTADIIASHFKTLREEVDWLENPEGPEIDLEKFMQELRKYNSQPLILVTNGEFIHKCVNQIANEYSIKNSLKPLVKGEVFLVNVSEQNITVQYY